MINFLEKSLFSLAEIKPSAMLLKLALRVNGSAQEILDIYHQSSESQTPELSLMSYDKFAALKAAVDPLKSLNPLILENVLPLEPAAFRLDEIRALCLGKFAADPSYDRYPMDLSYSGRDKKLVVEGQIDSNEYESHTTTSSAVTVNYPIDGVASVVGEDANPGLLQIASIANPALGVIDLLDQSAAPLPDGHAVKISYSALRYCAFALKYQGKLQAVIISRGLVDYLIANS